VAGDVDALAARILGSYVDALGSGGRAYVIEESEPALRALATVDPRSPAHFWQRIEALPELTDGQRRRVPDRLPRLMPEGVVDARLVRRRAGLGSLGRQRFALVGKLNGAWVGREAKALVGSAWHWAAGDRDRSQDARKQLVQGAIR
jgi:hypothetical protein